MWLIRVKDEVLVHFLYEQCPQYAILSHRWDTKNPEVSFNNMQHPEKAMAMENYWKIRQTCHLAATRGLEYVWIDTCCINRDSSAELSEAINSMYRWYQGAATCYAYLVDVFCEPNDENLHSAISESEWFDRGWTLQELIAPKELHFLNTNWVTLGTKSSLVETLHRKTGIALEVLTGQKHPTTQSIAQRMSWASRRQTTRIEDQAYCLLGVFDVNMPLLYGEGEKAFLRLQETILRSSTDHSIFAWPITQGHALQPLSNPLTSAAAIYDYHGLLAESPVAFESCGNVRRKCVLGYHSAHTITNRGLCVELYAALIAVNKYMVVLECDDDQQMMQPTSSRLANLCLTIFVDKLDNDGLFARTCSHPGISVARINDVNLVWWEGRPRRQYQKLTICIPLQAKHILNLEASKKKIFEDGFQFSGFGTWKPNDLTRYWQWDSGETLPIRFTPTPSSLDSHIMTRYPVILTHGSSQHPKVLYIILRFHFDGAMICIVQTEVSFRHDPQLGFRDPPRSTDDSFWSQQILCQSDQYLLAPGVWEIDSYHYSRDGVWAVKADPGGRFRTTLVCTTTNESLARLDIYPVISNRKLFYDTYLWRVSCEVLPQPQRHRTHTLLKNIGRKLKMKGSTER